MTGLLHDLVVVMLADHVLEYALDERSTIFLAQPHKLVLECCQDWQIYGFLFIGYIAEVRVLVSQSGKASEYGANSLPVLDTYGMACPFLSPIALF